MFITGLLIVLFAFLGIISSLVFLIIALFRRKKRPLVKTAGIIFTVATAMIILITGVEYYVYPINPKTDQLLLTAYREAPLGGIWLALYDDKTWEIGYSSREVTSFGTYELRSDTLTIFAADGREIITDLKETSFIFEKSRLVEVKNSGIRALEIQKDKISIDD